MARRGLAADAQEALVVVEQHRLLARILDNHLIRPAHVPKIGRLVEERRFVPLVPTRARQPLVRDVALENGVAFLPGAVVALAGGVVGSVVVFAAVADREAPLAG